MYVCMHVSKYIDSFEFLVRNACIWMIYTNKNYFGKGGFDFDSVPLEVSNNDMHMHIDDIHEYK